MSSLTKRKLVMILLLVGICAAGFMNDAGAYAKGKWPKGPAASSISAESAIVMDINTGTILYKKKIHDS